MALKNLIKGDQFRLVNRLDGETNTEPLQVPQLLNTQIANVRNLGTAATDAWRGADRMFVDVRDGAAERVDVLMSQPQGQGCKLGCSCVCHAHHRLQSPTLMNGLLGSLYIRYSGFATAQNRCNEYFCSKQAQFRGIFIYSFPQWLLGTCSQSHCFSIPATK